MNLASAIKQPVKNRAEKKPYSISFVSERDQPECECKMQEICASDNISEHKHEKSKSPGK